MANGTAEKVKEIVAEELGSDQGIVTPTARFVEDLGADSLDIVELVMELEEEFDEVAHGRRDHVFVVFVVFAFFGDFAEGAR